jgi:hypothetical protein
MSLPLVEAVVMAMPQGSVQHSRKQHRPTQNFPELPLLSAVPQTSFVVLTPTQSRKVDVFTERTPVPLCLTTDPTAEERLKKQESVISTQSPVVISACAVVSPGRCPPGEHWTPGVARGDARKHVASRSR